MDDLDRAQEREERDRELAIAAARTGIVLPSTGACHWCGEDVADSAHFCDADCRKDFERAQAAMKRNGRSA